MKKGYLLGAFGSLLLGLVTWKLLFPQITGLDGIYIFFLGFFCLWTVVAILFNSDISRPYRWGYAAVFFCLFLNQLAQAFFHFNSYILVNILLLSFIYLIQHLERRQEND